MRLPVNRFWPLVAAVTLGACGGGASVRDVPPQAANGPAADYPVVVGVPFTVDGTTYTPVDRLNYDAVGLAASGADGGSPITAAHRTLPLPSYAEVTSLDTGRTILVRVERRGPMTGPYLIELSPGATAQLGLAGADRTAVRVRRVNPPEVERAQLRTGQPAPVRMDTPKSLLAVLQRKLDLQNGVPAKAPSVDLTTTLPPAQNAAVTAAPAMAVVKATAATPAPQAAATIAPAPAGNWFVQIGTFASKANADAAAKKAGAAVTAAGRLWRVRLGPFADADKAKPALAKVKAAGYSDAVIQRAA